MGGLRQRLSISAGATLVIAWVSFFLAILLFLPPASAVANDTGSFTIKITGDEGGSVIPIRTRVSGTSVSGTFSGTTYDPLGKPLYSRCTFKGTMNKERISGRLKTYGKYSAPHYTKYHSETDGVVLSIDGNSASSGWFEVTNYYRDSVMPGESSYSMGLKLTADLTSLIESGYEFAPAGTVDTDGTAAETEPAETKEEVAQSTDDGTKDTSRSVLWGTAACLCVAAAAATALLSSGWSTVVEGAATVGNFFSKLFTGGVGVETAPAGAQTEPSPPPEEPPIKAEAREPSGEQLTREKEAQLRKKPLDELTGEQVVELYEEEVLTPKRKAPPRKEQGAEKLDKWHKEYRKYLGMFDDGRLTYDNLMRLRDWGLYENIPFDELEVRASLMVLTNQEYMEFYGYVVSKGIDDYADGKLWEQAAKVHPVASTISNIKDLATMPYDVVSGFYEYQDWSTADAVLKEYVASYGKDTSEVEKALENVKKDILLKQRKWQEKTALREKVAKWSTGEEEPITPLEKQQAASTDPDKLDQEISGLDKDIEAEQIKKMALDLRRKTNTGDWKRLVVKWGK